MTKVSQAASRYDSGFTETGELIAVTVVEATPNVVLQVKTVETDGYDAVQLGYQDKRAVLSNKPEQGHASKANTTLSATFVKSAMRKANLTQGMKSRLIHSQLVNTSTLLESRRDMASKVTLEGWPITWTNGSRISLPPSSEVQLGRIINRVFKGKLLPGRMGNHKRTMQNVAIVHVDVENNLLLLKGNVPGANKSLLTIKSTVKVNAKHPEVKMAGVSAPAAAAEEA